MQANYNFSDSDEDVDNEPEVLSERSRSYQLQDIDKLREQTKELLDPVWKESRNRHLIHKMLELEQPTVTAKMVDFLLQDGVCESLVAFVTQNGSREPRPGPNDAHAESMKLAYRAVILLSPETISDPLNAFLTKKAGTIARRLFDVFSDDSAGSFYHTYRVLECLLRCYAADSFEGLISDGDVVRRIKSMLRYIGFPPVCEMLVMLIALTPLPRSSPVFQAATKQRWSFLENLTAWDIFYHIALVMVNSEDNCMCSSYIGAEQHSSAAAQLLQDLIEKLSLEDIGEACLQSIGQSSAFLELLFDCMIKKDLDSGVRRSCARILAFLLRRAAEPEIVCFVASANNGPPTADNVPNRLFGLRERITNFMRDRINHLNETLLAFDEITDEEQSSVKYSSYEVKRPFSALRLFLVEVLVLCVESEDSSASMISLELWKKLIAWSLRYSNNNIYHALFYRLVFAVLRQGQETPQRLLFQKAKFASFLIDNFVPYSEVNEENQQYAKDSVYTRRLVARGLIMNCANAIRLQLNCQSFGSFLPNFLNNHPKWNEFIAQLTVATDVQMKFGMGIKVSIVDIKNTSSRESPSTFAMLISEAKPLEETMDINARFARSLGFYDDAEWSLNSPQVASSKVSGDANEESFNEQHLSEDSGSSRLSYLAEDPEFIEQVLSHSSSTPNS